MQKRVFLLTGVPGVGKTTVLIKAVDSLKSKGIAVGGMVSREVRAGNVRVGFEIVDLTSNKHGWLSHINQKSGPQVGKYHVNVQDLESVGVQAIVDAIEKYSVVVIDEIGPMELFSQKFRQSVKKALESRKLVLAIIHGKSRDSLIKIAAERNDAEILEVTLSNRESMPEKLTKQVVAVLNQHVK